MRGLVHLPTNVFVFNNIFFLDSNFSKQCYSTSWYECGTQLIVNAMMETTLYKNMWRQAFTIFKVTHRWYGEVQAVNFNDVVLSPETLNFTQLVWRDSREVGVGKAVGKDGFSVVVAQYSPPGNEEHSIQDNVQKLSRTGRARYQYKYTS